MAEDMKSSSGGRRLTFLKREKRVFAAYLPGALMVLLLGRCIEFPTNLAFYRNYQPAHPNRPARSCGSFCAPVPAVRM